MNEADIFLWVGPLLETGMDRVASSLDATVIGMMALPDLVIQDVAHEQDPHVWLDTGNAVAMATALASELTRLDPGNASRYAGNLAGFVASLDAAVTDIKRILDTDTFPPYVVYHDGYGYFEHQFGLAHLASFTTNEELQPGIRQVMAIKKVMEESNASCVVVTPSVNTRNLDNQLERDSMQFIVIDVLARDVTPARDAYSQWMKSVARAFTACRQ